MVTFFAAMLMGVALASATPPVERKLEPSVAATELANTARINTALDGLLPLLARSSPPATPARLEPAWQQLYDAAPLPAIVTTTRMRLDQLAARRRVAELAKNSRADSRRPRKRSLVAEDLRGLPDSAADQELERIKGLEAAYARLMGALGDRAHAAGLLTTAFRAYVPLITLRPDTWASDSPGRDVRYLDAASFMVLSAHQSEEVLALYRAVPLDRNPLDRAIVTQMDRWLTLYVQAPADLSNFSGIQQALGDLLYVLIEDPASATVLPEADRRRLLSRLAEAAIDRQHYAEAVGAYARLGDKKALQRLGRRLSHAVLIETGSMLVVQREVDLAIDALAEAGDTEALRELLRTCREARARIDRGDKQALNQESLALYVRHLESLVGEARAGGAVLPSSGEASSREATVGDEKARAITTERLAELIALYRGRAVVAVGPDRRASAEMLKTLGEEALSRGRLDLAIKAASARDDAGLTLVALGDRCVQTHEWALALDAYRAAGPQGISALRLLGDQLTTGHAVVQKGEVSPLVSIAVDAYLAADAVDRLEPLYNLLLDGRAELRRSGDSRQLAEIDAVIGRIEDAYDLVPRQAREVAKVPAKPAAPVKPKRPVGKKR